MTVAIYVYETSILQIENSGRVPIEEYDPKTRSGQVVESVPDGGKVELGPGVYRIVADREITVSGAGEGRAFEVRSPAKRAREMTATTLAANKDGWPDPPPKKVAGEWTAAEWEPVKTWLNARNFDPNKK
jgi:hypothetical protein